MGAGEAMAFTELHQLSVKLEIDVAKQIHWVGGIAASHPAAPGSRLATYCLTKLHQVTSVKSPLIKFSATGHQV